MRKEVSGMSALDFLADPSIVAFFGLAAIAVIAAVLVVEHKSLVYSAFFLGVLGMANAALFALLGFTFVGLFHVAVYIGAAVTFILFSITMFEDVPSIERPIRLAAVISVLLAFFMIAGVFGFYLGKPFNPTYLDYRELAFLLTQKYWFALVVAALTLVTTLIEAITLARTEEGE
jgi:NADH-quinone oxidoreductase subunit J